MTASSEAEGAAAAMRAPDDARWSLDLDLLASAVRIESSDKVLVEGLSRCFARAERAEQPAAWELEVFVERRRARERSAGGRYEVRCVPEGELGPALLQGVAGPLELCAALNTWAASRPTPFYVFHAGAVARDDRCILLPGASLSGKSTLTAGLLQRGFALLSDEIGAVDMATTRMRPYPRCLALRRDVFGLFGLAKTKRRRGLARMQPPETFGAVRAAGAPELVLAVVPRFRRDAPTRLERLSAGESVMALMQCSVTHRRLEAAGLDWVIALVRRIPVYRLEFSDLRTALDAVESTWKATIPAA